VRILLVNPNTTVSMTQKAKQCAEQVAAEKTQIIATQPESGPPSIEGFYDEVFCVPGLIQELQAAENIDGVVLACFDDTGLDAARCLLDAPVVGIGEAAFHMASMVSTKFSVVTTLSRSVAAIEHNLAKYGLLSRCSSVRASDIAVLDLEDPHSNAQTIISDEIGLALEQDGADAIVLGCAGMTDLAHFLQEKHAVPIIDGVTAAVKMVEGLIAMGVSTSKRAAYAYPVCKRYNGSMQSFSPK